MSGQFRRMGERVVMQELAQAQARVAGLSIAAAAMTEYFGMIPKELDAKIAKVLQDKDVLDKPLQEVIAAVVAAVREYKNPVVLA